MFPNSKNYFFDDETKESWISIRPTEFTIYNDSIASDRKVFTGKIKSLKRVASEFKLELKCNNLLLSNSSSDALHKNCVFIVFMAF